VRAERWLGLRAGVPVHRSAGASDAVCAMCIGVGQVVEPARATGHDSNGSVRVNQDRGRCASG
jgi:hypothetical protein